MEANPLPPPSPSTLSSPFALFPFQLSCSAREVFKALSSGGVHQSLLWARSGLHGRKAIDRAVAAPSLSIPPLHSQALGRNRLTAGFSDPKPGLALQLARKRMPLKGCLFSSGLGTPLPGEL